MIPGTIISEARLHLFFFVEKKFQSYEKTESYNQKKRVGEVSVAEQKVKRDK